MMFPAYPAVAASAEAAANVSALTCTENLRLVSVALRQVVLDERPALPHRASVVSPVMSWWERPIPA